MESARFHFQQFAHSDYSHRNNVEMNFKSNHFEFTHSVDQPVADVLFYESYSNLDTEPRYHGDCCSEKCPSAERYDNATTECGMLLFCAQFYGINIRVPPHIK